MELFVNTVLLLLMSAVTIAILRVRNLFAVVVLGGIYSFLMASLLVVLDAVDVAMTEASVGAGISTVLMLGALYLTNAEEAPSTRPAAVPLLVSLVVGGALAYGAIGLHEFGSPDAVIHKHVVPRYIEKTIAETTVPNVVTSVLADYRGYDTLGETTVIFTGGIGVLVLLRGRRRREKAGA